MEVEEVLQDAEKAETERRRINRAIPEKTKILLDIKNPLLKIPALKKPYIYVCIYQRRLLYIKKPNKSRRIGLV